ncbi:MAG: ferric anguibactin-binding protein, partial [Pseudomonas sp.]
MKRNPPSGNWSLALLLGACLALHGCNEPSAATPAAEITASQGDYRPVTLQHKLGTTVITQLPQRAVALDMNEVDFL